MTFGIRLAHQMGLGALDASRQSIVSGMISSAAQSGKCEDLATAVDTYRRLAAKTDKSTATRVAAGEMADQLSVAYTSCMSARGASASAPAATAVTPSVVSPLVPSVTPAPATGIVGQILQALVPAQTPAATTTTTTPSGQQVVVQADNTMRYLMYGGVGLAILIFGAWMLKKRGGAVQSKSVNQYAAVKQPRKYGARKKSSRKYKARKKTVRKYKARKQTRKKYARRK